MRETLTTGIANIERLTPVEIDEILGKCWEREAQAAGTVERLAKREAEDKLYYGEDKMLAEARIDLARAREDEQTIHAEFKRRGGWTRYWLVANADGHIHRNRACPQTYITTEWRFPFTLSGKTEDEMIEEVGHMACLVCFPQAEKHPAFIRTLRDYERQTQEKNENLCPASGKASPVYYDWTRPYGNHIKCPECGKTVSVTRGSNIRAHEPAKNADGKGKGIVNPDGTELRTKHHGTIKTERTAWIELVGAMDWLDRAGESNHYTENYEDARDKCAEALAHKNGITVAEVMVKANKKLTARRKREEKEAARYAR
jgi:hypothetical protein